MRKLLVFSLAFLFLTVSLAQADEKKIMDTAFWTLSASYFTGSMIDVGVTFHGLNQHRLKESNGFMRNWFYQRKFGLVWAGEILMTGGTITALRYAFTRKSLPLKIGVIVVLAAANYARISAINHNLRLNRSAHGAT